MTNPLIVSNEDLQKVIAMESSSSPSVPEQSATPNLRGFLVYSWSMSVSEIGILSNYLKKEERTYQELAAWDDSITDNKLGPDDRIIIRYIGSCDISHWPIEPTSSIYHEIRDARSGILTDFLAALLSVLPTVAETCQCHLIQYITTSAEDEEGFHELAHSILLEFFGISVVLNRHPRNDAYEWAAEREGVLADLSLSFDLELLGLRSWCPEAKKIEIWHHLRRIEKYVTRNPEETGVNGGMFELDRDKLLSLLGQSTTGHYKDRSIMVLAVRGMDIDDYAHGRSFAWSRNPDNQLIGQFTKSILGVDVRTLEGMPFAYYCLAPWPKHACLDRAIEFMWDYFNILKPMV
ncbi:hypothetical protein SAMD00023353_2001230 [Rosellinia necatrix]|uniref:Uncharacterized protein n=1 Tax=Rosellinia necatrix TaxID=77044 RepID=A0A1S8A7T4_ROSNE|nr:hypothetical protein SAMD00023353_2001230 [Rosellinia necatrix]